MKKVFALLGIMGLVAIVGCAADTEASDDSEDGAPSASTSDALSAQSCDLACSKKGFTCGGYLKRVPLRGAPKSSGETEVLCFCRYNINGRSCVK